MLWSQVTFEVTLEVMYSPMSRLPYSGIIEMVKFISWEKRSEKPFSVSFFPTKIISKGDLWVKLGVGYFNSCWNLLLPFWHVQWEFFPTVYSPALSCEKNAFRSFSSHIREGHYESQWAWGLGEPRGHWTSYKIKILSTWSPECFGSLWDSDLK